MLQEATQIGQARQAQVKALMEVYIKESTTNDTTTQTLIQQLLDAAFLAGSAAVMQQTQR